MNEPVVVESEMQMKPITILYGTETGNAEDCSEELSEELESDGFVNRVVDMEEYDCSELPDEDFVVVVTSTHGDGDPPENAADFLTHLTEDRPSLSGVGFAVCGFGDTSYRYFCQTGKDFDKIFEELGADRKIERVDCDDPPEAEFEQFSQNLKNYLQSQTGE